MTRFVFCDSPFWCVVTSYHIRTIAKMIFLSNFPKLDRIVFLHQPREPNRTNATGRTRPDSFVKFFLYLVNLKMKQATTQPHAFCQLFCQACFILCDSIGTHKAIQQAPQYTKNGKKACLLLRS